MKVSKIETSLLRVSVIPLSQGHLALVDDEDQERLLKFRWHVMSKPGTFYAKRSVRGTTTGRLLHHEVLGLPPETEVDHINGNGLDNRKSNLRVCTHSENIRNSRPNKQLLSKQRKSSQYRGVSWHSPSNKWQANIGINTRLMYLGSSSSEEEAARMYDSAARKYRGVKATLNFPDEE